MIQEELNKRQEYLRKIIRMCERVTANVPEGSLRVTKCRTTTQYFLRKPGENANGVYLAKDNMKLVKKLAEKEVFDKLKKEAEKEYKDNDAYLKKHPTDTLIDAYVKIPKLKRELVDSPVLTDEEFVERWLHEEYERKGFMEEAQSFINSNGDRVRSKSEVIISEILKDMRIPYLYEAPLKLKGVGTVYPDFKLLNVKERRTIYLEHFGMMDNPEYLEGYFRKQNLYVANGIVPGRDIIFTYESSKNPLDINAVRNLLKVYFHK